MEIEQTDLSKICYDIGLTITVETLQPSLSMTPGKESTDWEARLISDGGESLIIKTYPKQDFTKHKAKEQIIKDIIKIGIQEITRPKFKIYYEETKRNLP